MAGGRRGCGWGRRGSWMWLGLGQDVAGVGMDH